MARCSLHSRLMRRKLHALTVTAQCLGASPASCTVPASALPNASAARSVMPVFFRHSRPRVAGPGQDGRASTIASRPSSFTYCSIQCMTRQVCGELERLGTTDMPDTHDWQTGKPLHRLLFVLSSERSQTCNVLAKPCSPAALTSGFSARSRLVSAGCRCNAVAMAFAPAALTPQRRMYSLLSEVLVRSTCRGSQEQQQRVWQT